MQRWFLARHKGMQFVCFLRLNTKSRSRNYDVVSLFPSRSHRGVVSPEEFGETHSTVPDSAPDSRQLLRRWFKCIPTRRPDDDHMIPIINLSRIILPHEALSRSYRYRSGSRSERARWERVLLWKRWHDQSLSNSVEFSRDPRRYQRIPVPDSS